MNLDRFHARSIALETGARFRPVHTFVSDEAIWERRVTERLNTSNPTDEIATWERIQVQRREYRPWEPGTALFVDAVQPLEGNYSQVRRFVTGPDPHLKPLPNVSFTPGEYHQRDHRRE
jgi:hypothetical protein